MGLPACCQQDNLVIQCALHADGLSLESSYEGIPAAQQDEHGLPYMVPTRRLKN